jgi:antitoxin (DNA-binding transcriptional repressor) of toxin-antitoxin stability system
MPTVNVHAAISGEGVIIAKAGRHMVRLVPIEGKKERRNLGTLAGQFRVPDDLGDPLPDEVLDALKGADALPVGHSPAA